MGATQFISDGRIASFVDFPYTEGCESDIYWLCKILRAAESMGKMALCLNPTNAQPGEDGAYAGAPIILTWAQKQNITYSEFADADLGKELR